MKEIVVKISKVMQVLFGWGIFISLFAGGLTFLGYGVALVVGGEVASGICRFIYKTMYPILVHTSSISVVLGLVKMYLCGETALSARK